MLFTDYKDISFI